MSKTRYKDTHVLDSATSRRIGFFLFGAEPDPQIPEGSKLDQEELKFSRGLLASSIVNSPDLAKAISYYSTLRDIYGSGNARVIVDILQKMSMATEGTRSAQATSILEGQLPKEIEVETSTM